MTAVTRPERSCVRITITIVEVIFETLNEAPVVPLFFCVLVTAMLLYPARVGLPGNGAHRLSRGRVGIACTFTVMPFFRALPRNNHDAVLFGKTISDGYNSKHRQYYLYIIKRLVTDADKSV